MKRTHLLFVQAALCALSAIALIAAVLMIYIEGLAAKTNDPMADIYTVEAIADKSVFVLPLLCASVIVTILCAVLGVKAAETKRISGDISIRENTVDVKQPASALKIIRGVILLLAVIFVIIGICNGSFDDVFIKASKICTECIGLG